MRTPLINSPVLDAAVGARVFLKAETLQRTGSFKFRGAYNKISQFRDQRAGGVVAYSSGNHAQGVAAGGETLGHAGGDRDAGDAPKAKRERTLRFGAECSYDRNTEDRAAIANKIAAERGATLVPPYDDPAIIAGQGTIGREIVEDLTALGWHARHGGGRRLGRRVGGGYFTRRQGAGAGRKVLYGGAGRL